MSEHDEVPQTTTEQEPEPAPEPPKRKRLSKKPKSVEYEIENRDGEIEIWTLRELTGAGRDWYIDYMNGKMGKDDKLRSYSGVQAALLCKCLYNGQGKPVTEKEVHGFPSEMQTELYMDALRLSALDKEAEERAKKTSAGNV